MIGMMMSFTRDATIAPKATPMTTPIARSTTFPRIANFLNSSNIAVLRFRRLGIKDKQDYSARSLGVAAAIDPRKDGDDRQWNIESFPALRRAGQYRGNRIQQRVSAQLGSGASVT